MPVCVPFIRHNDAIVTVRPDASMERLGDRVECKFDQQSRDCPGLQIADFLAGDLRVFFDNNPGLLDYSTLSEPLMSKRLLFPQLFKVGKVDNRTMKKIMSGDGESFLASYYTLFANGSVSYYTRNGQMRHFNIRSGEIYDMID